MPTSPSNWWPRCSGWRRHDRAGDKLAQLLDDNAPPAGPGVAPRRSAGSADAPGGLITGSPRSTGCSRLTAEGGGLERCWRRRFGRQLLDEEGLIERILGEDGLATAASDGGLVDKLTARNGLLEQLADVADTLNRLRRAEALAPTIEILREAVTTLSLVVNPLSNIADRTPLPGRRAGIYPPRTISSERVRSDGWS